MKQKKHKPMTPLRTDGPMLLPRRAWLILKSKRIILTALTAVILLACFTGMAAESQQAVATDQSSAYRTIGLGLAAGLSVGISILGASYAVARIGSAAIGAISEKPELLPRAILFVALGEGLAVLGFAFAMLLLQKM